MSVKKKVPMRKCVGCGEMKNKKEMIRVLKTPEEEFVLDASGKKERPGCISVPVRGMSGSVR